MCAFSPVAASLASLSEAGRELAKSKKKVFLGALQQAKLLNETGVTISSIDVGSWITLGGWGGA